MVPLLLTIPLLSGSPELRRSRSATPRCMTPVAGPSHLVQGLDPRFLAATPIATAPTQDVQSAADLRYPAPDYGYVMGRYTWCNAASARPGDSYNVSTAHPQFNGVHWIGSLQNNQRDHQMVQADQGLTLPTAPLLDELMVSTALNLAV